MCYKPSEVYDGCGCPRPKTTVVRCSKADLLENFCEILKEFEERVNNRICRDCYDKLVEATKDLLQKNGMMAEVRKAVDLEWGDTSDEDTSDDSLLEIICDGRFELDGGGSVGLHSADGKAA